MINKKACFNKSTCVLFGLLLLFEYCVAIQLIEFSLWSQVDYLWETEFETALPDLKNHFLRYWLVLPFYILSTVVDAPPSYLFSFFIPLLVVTTAILVTKINRASFAITSNTVLFFVFFSLCSLPMNGRMIYVYVGSALLLYCSKQLIAKNTLTTWQLIVLFFSLWLAAVSSGTFIVAYAFLLLTLALGLGNKKLRLPIIHTLLLFYSLEAYKFVSKNIVFYGGGFEAVAKLPSHGADRFTGPVVGILAALVSEALSILAYGKIKHATLRISAALVLLGLACGIFELSILTIIVVPLVLIIDKGACFLFSVYTQQNVVANGTS